MNDSPEHVEPQSKELGNSPIADASEPVPPESEISESKAVCLWNGQEYSHNSTVCSNHVKYVCSTGGYQPTWFHNGTC